MRIVLRAVKLVSAVTCASRVTRHVHTISAAGSHSVRRLLATVTVAAFWPGATRPHLRVKSKLIILATC
jgi:hypothetical protein